MEDQQKPQENQSNLTPPMPPSNLPLINSNVSGSNDLNKSTPLPPAPVAPSAPSPNYSSEEEPKNQENPNETEHISPEFQSTIRTMEGDAKTLSQEGGVSGETIKRKFEGDLPEVTDEEIKPSAPAPKIERQSIVSLGEMEKARNLPTQRINTPAPVENNQDSNKDGNNKIEIPEPKKSNSWIKIILIIILL